MLRKTIFLLLSVGWLGGVWVEVIWAGETTPVKTAEKRTAKPQPGEKPTPLSETEKRALQDLWRNIYTRPEQLAKLSQPTVCILDIQHPDRIYEQLRTLPRPMEQFYACTFRAKVAEISGLPTLVVHATEITGQDLDRPQIKAILIGGRSKSLPREVAERFYPLIRQTKIPILGICGGCQLIGRAYGAKVTHMRKLQPGEADPNPKYHPGWFKEWGPTALEVLKPDPLFANLPEKTHLSGVPRLPDSGAACGIRSASFHKRVPGPGNQAPRPPGVCSAIPPGTIRCQASPWPGALGKLLPLGPWQAGLPTTAGRKK